METIDIILKSLIFIAFIICAIGLYRVSATIHDYLWYVETKKDKDKGLYTDGLWSKIFDEENNKDRYVTIFDEAHNRVKQLENENKELKCDNENLQIENKSLKLALTSLTDFMKKYSDKDKQPQKENVYDPMDVSKINI